ncbi:MAG: amidohydrolase family protein, partial [Synergistaceae bacterium]|nr:amidohydrolase family protein [Synergistaceae bacterium]
MTTKLFRHAHIYTPRTGRTPASGAEQGRIDQWPEGALLVKDGRIAAVGAWNYVEKVIGDPKEVKEYDLEGAAVIPGFVDPHTHACFAAKREAEFSMRLAGKPYLDILKAGGGILSSVRSVRSASEEDLFRFSRRLLETTLHYGTTTIEIKSGYGLDTETEMKMLRVIGRLGRETPQSVVPSFMGAHAIPEEHRPNPEGYME